MAKKAAKKPAKRPPYRLKDISDEQMSALQRALRDAIYSGPRGIRKRLTGPFSDLAERAGTRPSGAGARRARPLQDLRCRRGCRRPRSWPPRKLPWKAHYEWFSPRPAVGRGWKAGVKPQTVKDIQAGRTPKTAAKDELAIIEFVKR